MQLNLILLESELLEFLKERLTIDKINDIKILSAGIINAVTIVKTGYHCLSDGDCPNLFMSYSSST